MAHPLQRYHFQHVPERQRPPHTHLRARVRRASAAAARRQRCTASRARAASGSSSSPHSSASSMQRSTAGGKVELRVHFAVGKRVAKQHCAASLMQSSTALGGWWNGWQDKRRKRRRCFSEEAHAARRLGFKDSGWAETSPPPLRTACSCPGTRSPASASSCRPSFSSARSAASRAARAREAPSSRRRSSEAVLRAMARRELEDESPRVALASRRNNGRRRHATRRSPARGRSWQQDTCETFQTISRVRGVWTNNKRGQLAPAGDMSTCR